MLTRKKKAKIAKNLAYVIVALENTKVEIPAKLFCKCQDKLMDIAEMFDNKTLDITYFFIKMLRSELEQRSDT